MIPSQAQQFGPATTGLILISGRGVLTGWAIKETTGAAVAAMTVRDGLTSAGLTIAPINLAANESNREWFSDWGIAFTSGLFLDITAGSISGALWIIPQGLVPVGGQAYAYAQGPEADGYPSLGIDGTE